MDISSKKILVIRLSSLGDVVLSTPVIRLLSLQGRAKVDVLTKDQYIGVFDENPYVSNVFDYASISVSGIEKGGYDYIIDLQNNLRSRKLTRNVKSTVLRFKKQPISKWMFLNLGIDKLSNLHVSEQFIRVLEELGIEDDGYGLNIYPTEIDSTTDFKKAKKKVVIAMGGTYVTKRIPIDLANRFISETDDCEYMMIGGGGDTKIDGLVYRDNVHNLISKTTLSQSIALISQADVVITGDTGMMHIAAALQKPIIVIWGSTSEDFGFYPYYGAKSKQEYASVAIDNLSCRPCSKYGRSTCPKGHMNCLKLLSGQMVREEVMRLLAK